MANSRRVMISKRRSRRVRRGGWPALEDLLKKSRNDYLENLSKITDCSLLISENKEFEFERKYL